MRSKPSIRSNLIFNLAYQVLSIILPLITAPYISRVLGAEGIGTYGYASSIALYFIYFGMLGVSNYGNRRIAQVRDNRQKTNEEFSGIYYFQLMTGIIAILAYIIYVIIIVREYKLIAAIQIIYVLFAILDISWFFFGIEEFKLTIIRQTIIRILTVVFIFIFVKNKDDLWIYALIMAVGNIASPLSLWPFLKARVSFVRVPLKKCLSHAKECFVLFIPVIATSVFGVMDKIMLGSLCSMEDAGYYENADKIILMASAIVTAFNNVLMPKISNLFSNNKRKEAMYYFGLSLEVVMCVEIAICFGIAAVAEEFVLLFYGNEYVACGPILIGLAFSIPFVGWSHTYRVLYLIPAEKDVIYLKSTLYGAILNLILNITFILSFGRMGAVYATVASHVFISAFQTYKVRKSIYSFEYMREILGFVFIGMIMYIIVRFIAYQLNGDIYALMVEILIGAIIYIIGSIFLLLYRRNDIILGELKNLVCR